MGYEYKVVVIKWLDMGTVELSDILSELGRDRWHLIFKEDNIFFFERELDDTKTEPVPFTSTGVIGVYSDD